jgi:acyltransferase
MSPVAADPQSDTRIPWVDTGKALGIALVFHGHLLQRFGELGAPGAFDQMRWIYSFHMPFFFLLVGFVYKERGLSLERFVKRQILTRLVPAWTFNLVSMLIWVALEATGDFSVWEQRGGWPALGAHCADRTLSVFVYGRPAWNVVTWFLFCLFTAEMLHFALRRLLRSPAALCVSIVLWGTLAVLLNVYSEEVHNVLGARRHWWMASSAVTALVFYQLGVLLRRLGWLSARLALGWRCGLAGGCLLVSLLTFNLNDPVTSHSLPVVLMVDAFYGDIGWFFVAAVAGSGFVIYTSQLVSRSRALGYVGQITLTLLCLDGVIEEFINPGLARLSLRLLSDPASWSVTLLCVSGSMLSLIACLPLHALLVRTVPFVLGQRGRPRAA